MENEQLKQEVAHLGKALYDKKGKAKQIQPPQDNTTAGVNKSVEGETLICRLCHKEGHKSFQCKSMTRDKQSQKLKQKPSSKISNTYIKKVDKNAATPYLIKKKKNGKVIAIKANLAKSPNFPTTFGPLTSLSGSKPSWCFSWLKLSLLAPRCVWPPFLCWLACWP